GRLFVEPLGGVEQRPALLCKLVEGGRGQRLAVQLEVVREPEVADGGLNRRNRVEVDRVHPLVEDLVCSFVELLPLVAIRLVCNRGPNHPERDLLAVDGPLDLGLERRELLRVLSRQLAEVAFACESPELTDALAAVHREPDRLDDVSFGQIAVALVDGTEVERLLQPRVVEIELLVQLGYEA